GLLSGTIAPLRGRARLRDSDGPRSIAVGERLRKSEAGICRRRPRLCREFRAVSSASEVRLLFRRQGMRHAYFALVPLASLAITAPAYCAVYLSVEQAQKLIFPGAS